MTRDSDSDLTRMKQEYDAISIVGERLRRALEEQFIEIVLQNDISLAVPIQSRIKDWTSTKSKIESKKLDKVTLSSVSDIVGIRLITLFQGDVEKLDEIIRRTFIVISSEDTASRMDETQFGYRSNHYDIRIPDSWSQIPSYQGLNSVAAELQVRTLPQHMWAAASHKLQYKREQSVPAKLRRSINRVAAILEIVDIEFSRILSERDYYVKSQTNHGRDENDLNVDIVSAILAEIFPAENQDAHEDIDRFLEEVEQLGIARRDRLRQALIDGRDAAMQEEKNFVRSTDPEDSEEYDRLRRGVYFTHVGLGRAAIRSSVGPLPGDSNFED